MKCGNCLPTRDFLQDRRHCKKSRKSLSVIPAKAGIHSFQIVKKAWIPFFKGMTTFCSDIRTDKEMHSE